MFNGAGVNVPETRSGLDLGQVRRMEAVAFRSFPATTTYFDGTWAIRLTAGHPAKRLNSVNPLDPSDIAHMDERIEAAEWLSPSSRRASHAKLDAMRLAVSHPSEWLDDPRLVIRADDYYGNGRRASEALRRRALDRLGEPVLLDEWGLPPIWVGGFYSSGLNAVYMTAAQLLFFAGEDGQLEAGDRDTARLCLPR